MMSKLPLADTLSPALYAVIGNPIAHSKSPMIHTLFAAQTAQNISYIRILAPLTDFPTVVQHWRERGGQGANVTVPFKEIAWGLADKLTPRALLAQAVNTLKFTEQGIEADNTDGVGLIHDLQNNLNFSVQGKRVLLLGAGGAARGAAAALLRESPECVVIANRTVTRAQDLVQQFSSLGTVRASEYMALQGERFDCVINATSTSLTQATLVLPTNLFSVDSFAYDMMYANQPTMFMRHAMTQGAARCADGLGMLVEQAAVSFAWWRGVLPNTRSVIDILRARMAESTEVLPVSKDAV